MKKLLFSSFLLLSLSTVIYASFPVTDDGVVIESSMDHPDKSNPEPDWGLAAVCWIGGIFGIHRFMMEDTTNGLLMLFTLGGCGIWALIDLINILMGNMSR